MIAIDCAQGACCVSWLKRIALPKSRTDAVSRDARDPKYSQVRASIRLLRSRTMSSIVSSTRISLVGP